jgi:hypothetical protein
MLSNFHFTLEIMFLEIPELRKKKQILANSLRQWWCSSALEWTIIASNQQNSRHVVQSTKCVNRAQEWGNISVTNQ